MKSRTSLGGALGTAAFDELYRTRWLQMVRLAALILGDSTAAEDIAQEAFVNTYRRWEKMTSVEGAASYVRVAVVNGCRSALRRRGAIDGAFRRLTGRSIPEKIRAPENDLAERDAILQVLYQLPPRQREVLVLRYLADLSEAETASALSISRGAVKSNSSRALAHLRERTEDLNA